MGSVKASLERSAAPEIVVACFISLDFESDDPALQRQIHHIKEVDRSVLTLLDENSSEPLESERVELLQ